MVGNAKRPAPMPPDARRGVVDATGTGIGVMAGASVVVAVTGSSLPPLPLRTNGGTPPPAFDAKLARGESHRRGDASAGDGSLISGVLSCSASSIARAVRSDPNVAFGAGGSRSSSDDAFLPFPLDPECVRERERVRGCCG